jgi:hypothetical protein
VPIRCRSDMSKKVGENQTPAQKAARLSFEQVAGGCPKPTDRFRTATIAWYLFLFGLNSSSGSTSGLPPGLQRQQQLSGSRLRRLSLFPRFRGLHKRQPNWV